MLFREYETSCKRHMRACDSLLENLPKYPIDKQTHILHEVYYLAGYIFECIYKYAIFKLIPYPDNKSVKELNHYGLTYNSIAKHAFSKLKDILDTRTTCNIPFIKYTNGIEAEILKLYDDWGPKFRYEENPLVSEERMRKFLYWAKKTREEILSHI